MKECATDIKACWKFSRLRWRELVHQVAVHFRIDRVTDQSAQLSYYFFFAIFPLMLAVTALIGFFAEPGTFLHTAIADYLSKILPGTASGMIETELRQISTRANAGKFSIGLLVAIWSASSGMSAIIDSLNISYEVKKRRPWWRQKLLAIALTLVVSVLLLVSLALVMYGGGFASTLAGRLGFGNFFTMVWDIAQWPILLASLTVAFSLIYYFAPNIKRSHWHWLMPGTVVGVALWVLVSIGLRLYIHFFNNYNVMYGSIGAIILLLLWFYLSGVALLVGAEVNSAIERALSSGEESPPADAPA